MIKIVHEGIFSLNNNEISEEDQKEILGMGQGAGSGCACCICEVSTNGGAPHDAQKSGDINP
jgi:hypothetical protein